MTPRISCSAGQPMPAEKWWKDRGFRWAMAERADGVEVLALPAQFADSTLFSNGIAFGPDAELRWAETRRGLHLVLIADDGSILPGAADENVEPMVVTGDSQVFLWGERGESGYYWESRIPRALAYPGIDGDLAAATTRSYRFITKELTTEDERGHCRRERIVTRLVDLHGASK